MEIDIQDRKSELEGLNIFITHISSKLETIFNSFGWSEEFITKKNDNIKVCNVDKKHRIPKNTFHEHIAKCEWKNEGYLEDDVPFSEPSHSKATVIIDKTTQEKVIDEAASKDSTFVTGPSRDIRLVPRSSNRLTSDFSVDERIALYDYAVAKTKSNYEKIGDINVTIPQTSESTLRNKSIFELLAEERDAKRRRTKYKSVHTNHKSQTEILREVIENQMEMLYDYLKTESPLNTVSEKQVKQEVVVKKEIRKSSDRETVRSLDSEKYSRRSDESVTSRKSRGELYKSGSSSRHSSKYDDKSIKHIDEKRIKLEKKTSKYDEDLSKYNDDLNKYDEKLRRYEEGKKRHYRDIKDRSPIRDYFIDNKRGLYDHEFGDNHSHKYKDFERKEYNRHREKRSDEDYHRKHYRSRSRDKHKHYSRR